MRKWMMLALLALAAACGGDDAMGDTDAGPTGPEPGELGWPCARNADCNSGLCLEAGVCTESCVDTATCPESWACDPVPGAGLLCQCSLSSVEELCNGVDDDCDGVVDLGATCPEGLVCEGGSCTCPPEERCDGECVDRQSDARHCGACGNACPSGQACEGGACVVMCSAGQTRCGDSCVDVASDARHCGACDAACSAGGVCEGGACVCAAGTT
ncbi:MAG: hypothetical protein CMH59_25435, partial [Myxococcales bacterium]|nr:hypothetical protein [Myxococcales bacterium]